MSGTKQRTIQKGKSTPVGYKPAYFKPIYAREWGSFGCPPISATMLRAMGAPTCIEKNHDDIVILYIKESR